MSLGKLIGGIVEEVAPEFHNWLNDSRKRHKAIKAFARSRRRHTGLGKETIDADAGEGARGYMVPNRQARAIPKLATRGERCRRIAAWRTFRPVFRWHRRAPVPVVLGTYLGILGVLSLSATAYFFVPQPQPSPTPAKHAPSGPVSMQLGKVPDKAFEYPLPSATDSARMESEAEAEFQAGNFAAAERHFRKILPTTHFRALVGFQIFLCLLKQGKTAEAELLARNFPTSAAAKNPSGSYALAAIALSQGRSDDALQLVENARRRFPLTSPLYDKALSEASLKP